MKFCILLRIYALLALSLGLINPIVSYNTQYESIGYGQGFLTANAIILTILLLNNVFLIYPLIIIMAFDIKFMRYIELNIFISIFLTIGSMFINVR